MIVSNKIGKMSVFYFGKYLFTANQKHLRDMKSTETHS